MTPRYPYEWITLPAQWRAFWALFAVTIIVMATLQVFDTPLKGEVAPSGIVPFEFAGDLPLA